MNIGYKNHQTGYSYKTKSYWRHQILSLQKGTLLLKTKKIISKVKPGQIILFPKNSEFELECLEHYSGLFFADEELNVLAKEATTLNTDQASKTILKLVEEELKSSMPHQELMESFAQSIVLKINKPFKKKFKKTTKDIQKQIAFQIKSILEANVHSNESTEELLKPLHLSYRQLSRNFQKYFESSIKNFHIQLRIKKVQELLTHQQLSVTTIAYELGFSSSQHLSNQFKKITGHTPIEWNHLKDQKHS